MNKGKNAFKNLLIAFLLGVVLYQNWNAINDFIKGVIDWIM